MDETGTRSTNVPLGAIAGLIRLAYQGDADLGLRCLLRLATIGNALRAEMGLRDGVSASELGLGIHVEFSTEEQLLVVRDDGVGLTADDLRQCIESATELIGDRAFAAFGRHDPRSMDDYRLACAALLLHLLPFGEELTVESLSCVSGSTPCRLRYAGGDKYSVEPGTLATPGTMVSVRFEPGRRYVNDSAKLVGLLRCYGDFLQFPVFWDGRQINTMSPPWHRAGAGEIHYGAFLRGRYPDIPPPLLVIPLQVQRPEIEARGVLWVPGEQVSVLDENLGTVDLYWRRVLMQRSVPGLLPTWARFFRGIVDCDRHPTELRGGQSGDDADVHLIDIIEQVILTGIRRVLILNPGSFEAVAHQHNTLLKLAALENDELFEIVADQLPFDTAAGPRTLIEHVSAVMRQTGATAVRYLASDPLARMVTYRARGEEIIDASHGLDEEVLKKYDRHNPTIELVDMSRRTPDFVENVVDPSMDPLLEVFAGLEMPVVYRLARFDSPSPAAILTATERAESQSDLEQLFLLSQITGAMPADARAAMQRALSARPSLPRDRILHINLTAPEIRALRAAIHRKADTDLIRQVAEAIVVRTMILAGGLLDPADLQDVGTEMMCRLLEYNGDEKLQWSGP